jgi:hypothetical protein
MKKTLLATSVAFALGLSSFAYAQPTLTENDNNNLADNYSNAMDDDNNNAAVESIAQDDDNNTGSYGGLAQDDDNNNASDGSIAQDDYNNNLEHSYNSKTDNSVNTLTKTKTETETEVKDSYNVKTKTDNSVETEDSYNVKTKTDSSVNRWAHAEKGSIAMNDGNTVYNTETEIGDIEVELAVNSSDLDGYVSYNSVTTTFGEVLPTSATVNAYNLIDNGSANFKGVGIVTQNSGTSSLNQASINVQSNLAF